MTKINIIFLKCQELIEMAKKDLEKNKAEQKRRSSRAKTSIDEDKVKANLFYEIDQIR